MACALGKDVGRYRGKIRSVVISEGVTSTGMNAFADCTELSSIELPGSMIKIGDSSFYNCRKLTSIALPSGVAEIESYAFEACISLRSIVLPSGVSRIQGSTFYGCSNLERVEIEGELTEIEGFAFYECSSLREVEVPEGMTEINTYTFYGCSSLKSILIPEQIKRIEGFAFAGCSGLTELALPSGVTEIGEYAFADCSGLAELALPSGVTKIGEYAFAGCSGLTELTVPSGITEIKDYTFAWCTKLTRLNVPDTFIAYGKNVFCGCNDALGVYRSGHSEAITPGGLSDLAGAESSNKGTQNYNTYGRVVTSYLEENGDGTMNRIEYVGKRHDDGLAAGRYNKIGNYVTAERCSMDGRVLDRKKIPVELPLFGGFYAGEDYNFLVFGQPNPDEDDSVEVMRVVKYTKDWQRLDSVGLYGANTTEPFEAGSLRMAQSGDLLFVRTCHEMYALSNGEIHQANVTFSVQVSTMEVVQQSTGVSVIFFGYVTHSFNQFVLVDGQKLVAADHGDAHPRAIVLSRYEKDIDKRPLNTSCDTVDVFPLSGFTGDNNTGASVGGLEASETSYLVAGNSLYKDLIPETRKVRNIFVTCTQKDNFTSEGTALRWITSYKGNEKVSTPHLVKLSDTRFLLMWDVDGLLNYVFLDGEGNPEGEIYTSETGALSNCKPIVCNGMVTWYCTEGGVPLYYALDPENPEKVRILNEVHRVKFYPLGGEMDSDFMDVRLGEAYGKLPEPVRAGYIFKGWRPAVQGGDRVTADTIVTAYGDEKLYADWHKIEPCGENLTWEIQDRTLLIHGTGEMYDWRDLKAVPWETCAHLFDKVVIDEGVSSIGDYAFSKCGELVDIKVPEGVTRIGYRAFESCVSLEGIEIPRSVTSIGSYVFNECVSLRRIEIPEGVTAIGVYAFGGCSSLQIVEIPESVAEIGSYAFVRCGSMEGILLPDGLRALGDWAFGRCSNLKSIDLPEGLTGIGGYTFYECSSLENLVLPGEITRIGEKAFGNCTGLLEVTVLYSVDEIDDTAFSGVNENLRIFGYKYSEADIYAKEHDIAFEKIPCDVFEGACGENLAWTLQEGILTISGKGKMENWAGKSETPWYAYRRLFHTAAVGEGVENIGAYAFYGCGSLENVVLPQSVAGIGQYAFRDCKRLKEIRLPEGVASLERGAFYECVNLSRIELPETIRSLGTEAFAKCAKLAEIRIPYGIKSIGQMAFYKTDENFVMYGYEGSFAESFAKDWRITFVAVPLPPEYEQRGSCGENLNWILKNGVLTIRGAGEMQDWGWASAPWHTYRKLINRVVISDGVTGIGNYAFSGCENLMGAEIAEGVASVGTNAFLYCRNLEDMRIPESVTDLGASAFRGCSGLINVTIPENVTHLGTSVFEGCSGLISVTIPESVTDLGTSVFEGCSSLVSAKILGNIKYIYSDSFKNCPALTEVAMPYTVISISNTAFEGHNENLVMRGYRKSAAEAYAQKNSITFEPIHYEYAGSCGSDLTGTLADGILVIRGTGEMTDWRSDDGVPWYSYRNIMEEVVVGKEVTSISGSAFHGYTRLKEVTFQGNMPEVKGYGFSNVTANGHYPAGNRSWENVKERFGSGIFTWSEFHTVDMPCGEALTWTLNSEGILSISGDGEMTPSESWDQIPWHACADMISGIAIEDGVTAISPYAFYGCVNLKNIQIPASMASIGEFAFGYCSDLTEGRFEGNRPSFGKNVFHNVAADMYYPPGDASWNGIEEVDTGGRLSWSDHLHVAVEDMAIEATCTETGKTAGSHCGICNRILEAQQETEALGHRAAEDAPEEATCTKAGKTAGSHCSVCGEILEEQREVAALGHTEGEEMFRKEPACTETGFRKYICAVCGEEQEEILEMSAHLLTYYEAQRASCTEPGVVEHWSCDTCGKAFLDAEGAAEADVLAESPLGHEYVGGGCIRCGERNPDGESETETETEPDSEQNRNPAINGCMHEWNAWKTTEDATVFAEERQERVCSVCGSSEKRSYDKRLSPYIKLMAKSLKMQLRQATKKFKVTGMAKGDSVVSVSSSNQKILKVSQVSPDGAFKLKAQKKKGRVKLTITLASGLKKTVNVKVQKEKVKTTKVTVKSKNVSLTRGKKISLEPVIAPVTSQEKITCKSSNKKIAAVNAKGVVTARKAGTAKIVVSSGKKKVIVTVKVGK